MCDPALRGPIVVSLEDVGVELEASPIWPYNVEHNSC